MQQAAILAEVWRGEFLESQHRGHAVVCDAGGSIVASWGDPNKIILPRSSCKMLQALPLLESGAADSFGLNDEHLALACASHQGATMHSSRVVRWLADLGMTESDLLCGAQLPADRQTRIDLYGAKKPHDQTHNNCSGKHTGFLTLNKHLKGSTQYVDPDHLVQKAVLSSFEEMIEETSPGYGIDGCSAPNFGGTITGLARAMAKMAQPIDTMGRIRSEASRRLVQAMAKHPELVAGEGQACTELMRAMSNGTVVKTGAEAVFVGILPERGLGVAVKVEDGGTRGSECAIAALMVRLGVAEAADPLVAKRLFRQQKNRAGITVGEIRASNDLYQNGKPL